MHEILRRLGSGIDGTFHGSFLGGSSRARAFLPMLRSQDSGDQITGLTELCEHISVSSEDSMMSFPLEQVVPLLIQLLKSDSPDVMLLAARGITLLADVFPPSIEYITRHHGVPALCEKLLAIEYIDVAEQSIQALEKLSHENGKELLKEGALGAVLSFIDFFQIGMQRVAVSTASNICTATSAADGDDVWGSITSAVPMLINLLNSSDLKIVQHACNALISVAKAYSASSERMNELTALGLVERVLEKV